MVAKIFKQERYFLLSLFIVSLLARLFFYLVFLKNNPCVLTFDSGQYHAIAKSLIEGNGFASQLYRLPGYPLFLALGYSLFGFNVHKFLLMQIFLASFLPRFYYPTTLKWLELRQLLQRLMLDS
jgi:hypothetical protein